jgi:hypothetical protein
MIRMWRREWDGEREISLVAAYFDGFFKGILNQVVGERIQHNAGVKKGRKKRELFLKNLTLANDFCRQWGLKAHLPSFGLRIVTSLMNGFEPPSIGFQGTCLWKKEEQVLYPLFSTIFFLQLYL